MSSSATDRINNLEMFYRSQIVDRRWLARSLLLRLRELRAEVGKVLPSKVTEELLLKELEKKTPWQVVEKYAGLKPVAKKPR